MVQLQFIIYLVRHTTFKRYMLVKWLKCTYVWSLKLYYAVVAKCIMRAESVSMKLTTTIDMNCLFDIMRQVKRINLCREVRRCSRQYCV